MLTSCSAAGAAGEDFPTPFATTCEWLSVVLDENTEERGTASSSEKWILTSVISVVWLPTCKQQRKLVMQQEEYSKSKLAAVARLRIRHALWSWNWKNSRECIVYFLTQYYFLIGSNPEYAFSFQWDAIFEKLGKTRISLVCSDVMIRYYEMHSTTPWLNVLLMSLNPEHAFSFQWDAIFENLEKLEFLWFAAMSGFDTVETVDAHLWWSAL